MGQRPVNPQCGLSPAQRLLVISIVTIILHIITDAGQLCDDVFLWIKEFFCG